MKREMNFPHSKKTTEKWQKTLMFAFRIQMMKETAAQPANQPASQPQKKKKGLATNLRDSKIALLCSNKHSNIVR
jgi:hypothetical protein